jgi:ribonuclease VapC
MIVVDTSAIIAIVRKVDDASVLIDILDQTSGAYLSVVSYVEAHMVATGRRTNVNLGAVDDTIKALGIEVVPVTVDQGIAAIATFVSYGKGRHSARLNFADCFTYALAKTKGLPLLFKGDDFLKTAIVPAWRP